MKTLTLSVKSSRQFLDDARRALTDARRGKLKGDYYGIAFQTKKEFDRFVKNLGILSAILIHKPKSVYELAKIVDMDVSNLNKLITFFEMAGAIKIKTSTVAGRTIKTPTVEYDRIAFDLKATG